MTVQELKTEATRLKDAQDYESALPLYVQIWGQEKSDWNGYRLAYCHRRLGNFDEAKELYRYFNEHFPNFPAIKTEILWQIYDEKIKQRENPNLIEDAEALIAQTDQYNKYTGTIYVKTVLRVIKLFRAQGEYIRSLEWLLKLDQSVLSSAVYSYQGQSYAADRKVYFVLLADTLINLDIHVEYIERCLRSLNFDNLKLVQFVKHIVETISMWDTISRRRLGLFIKHIQEESALRKREYVQEFYSPEKVTLVSDLSHFLFCPASFAINETFKVDADMSWEKDEWTKQKLFLVDRHRIFQRGLSYEEAFSDFLSEGDPNWEKDFRSIFESRILVNNSTNPNPTVYSNSSNTLRGAPDYVFEHPTGYRFSVTEKFSRENSEKRVFENDLVKHYAFLEELKSVNVSFGYFINWYWELRDDAQGGMSAYVRSYTITKVDSNSDNATKLDRAIQSVSIFKSKAIMQIDGDKISYPNKCLNCSVVSYCNHKTGKLNEIELPYNLHKLSTTNGDVLVNLYKKYSSQAHDGGESNDLPF